jgi:hypothetical protein
MQESEGLRQAVAQVSEEQETLTCGQHLYPGTQGSNFCRSPSLGWQGPVSAAARGTGSRMELEASTAKFGSRGRRMRVTSSRSLSRRPARTGRRSGAGTHIHQRPCGTACLSTYATSQVFFFFLCGVTEEEVFTRHQSILPTTSRLHEVCGNIAALGK